MHTHPNKRLVYNIPSPRDISLFYYYPELKVQVIITHNGMYILTRPENDQGEFDVQARRFVCEFKIMEEVLVTYVDTQITDKGRASFAFNNIIREYSRSNRFVRYAPHQRLLQDIFDKNLQILGDAANMPPELKSISDRILQLTRRDAKRKCS